jgi:outer membrane receptor protein involved in Fe transport
MIQNAGVSPLRVACCRKSAALALLCCLLVAGVAQTGVSTLKQLSVEELSQIELVTASREPTDAFESPVAIYVITGDQIRRHQASRCLAAGSGRRGRSDRWQ